MKRLALALLLALPFTAALADDAATDNAAMNHMDHVVMQADAVKWGPAPPLLPAGAQAAVLLGDPSKEGPFTIRLSAPDGYKVPPHFHPTTENVTVISGTFHVGTGDKLDTTKGEALTA